MVSAYELLDVDPGADEAAIRRAYRRAALRYHPDKNSAPDAAETFQLLNDALATLLDMEARAELDAGLSRTTESRERLNRMSERSQQLREQLNQREQEARTTKRARAAQVDISALILEGYQRRRALDMLQSERPVTTAMRSIIAPNGATTVFDNVEEARAAIDKRNGSAGAGRWRLGASWHPRAYSRAYEAATLARVDRLRSAKSI